MTKMLYIGCIPSCVTLLDLQDPTSVPAGVLGMVSHPMGVVALPPQLETAQHGWPGVSSAALGLGIKCVNPGSSYISCAGGDEGASRAYGFPSSASSPLPLVASLRRGEQE